MKFLLKIFIVLVMSLNALATPLSAGSLMYLEFTGTENGRDLFTFYVPDGADLVSGELYYFESTQGRFQAIYNGKDGKGRADWGQLEPATNFDSDVEGSTGSSSSSVGVPFGQAHSAGLGAAIRTGVGRSLYRGLIDNEKNRAELREIQIRTEADRQAIEQNYRVISEGIDASRQQLRAVLLGIKESIATSPFNGRPHGYTYKSPDAALVKDLTEIETLLRKARVATLKTREARDFGLQMIVASDSASAEGDNAEALAYRRYAECFLDIAVGLDPVTGVLRDVYEAFAGKNFITGEELGNLERSFAIMGALTFGFGTAIVKGIKVFNLLKKTEVLEQALEAVPKISAAMMREVHKVDNGAHNAANYQKYLRQLRGEMERPVVDEPKLKDFLTRYWRPDATVGNGSTAAAIRFEKMTGQKVKGRWHAEKGQTGLIFFERWLKENPAASPSDRRMVENLILDLRDALGGL